MSQKTTKEKIDEITSANWDTIYKPWVDVLKDKNIPEEDKKDFADILYDNLKRIEENFSKLKNG